MKKFLIKMIFVLLLLLVFPGSLFIFNSYVDTFNIFHWRNIRFTDAEPNKNFIKTKYVISNPKKFNAFVLGSSRSGMLLPDCLPKTLNGKELHWYNLAYSEGVPAENLETIKALLNGKVDVSFVIVSFDCLMMHLNNEAHKTQLLRLSYPQYKKNPLGFYKNYFINIPAKTIASQVLHYKPENHMISTEIFYKYGVNSADMGLSTELDDERYKPSIFEYTMTDSWKSLKEICDFCKEKGIKIVLFTSPVYESNYRYAAAHGYLDMLGKIGRQCEFYNFSGLNKISTDRKYYFEASHYRPVVGLMLEKMIFSDDEAKKERTRREVALSEEYKELFGLKVTPENVDSVVEKLKKQFREFDK